MQNNLQAFKPVEKDGRMRCFCGREIVLFLNSEGKLLLRKNEEVEENGEKIFRTI